VPIALTPDQLALQASIRDWAKQAGPLAAVRRLEPGAPAEPAAWGTFLREAAGLGIFSIAVPEHAGGAGGTLTDLAAALEQLAIALVPGPVMPTALAAALLTTARTAAAGTTVGTTAGTAAPGTAAGTAAARTATAGTTALLQALTAGQATAAVALTAAPLTAIRQPDGSVCATGQAGPVLGAGTTSHLLLGATTDQGEAWFWIAADHPALTVTSRRPVDFSRSLADVALADAAVPAAQILPGLDTAKVRDLAATLYTAEAAGVAGWCSATAADYAKTRRQFGRVIGEFQAVKHLCATMACRAERAAALAWDAARAAAAAPAEHPLAAAAAAALALDDAVDNAKDCIQVLGGIGFTWEHDAHLYLRRALALRALLGGSAPWRARAAALAAAGARRHLPAPASKPSPYPGIGAWAGPAIETYGTAEQRDRFLGPTRRAEITWCQLFSEPEAGSDLAGLLTRAERADGGWRLTGQKVWTSLARQADWAIGLARTDPDVPKHQGLTYFLVDMHAPGLDIRPLREITGRTMFNEVFLDGVFVPDDCVLGAPGDGWRIAMSTLATERVAIGAGQDEAVEALLAAGGARSIYAERTGLHVAAAACVALLGERGAHPAIRKLIGTGHRQAIAETILDLLGPDGAAEGEASGEFLLTRCLSIAGGTTQILLNQVAERVLGLPR
jgi:3-oxochol-4-en-24-oyl-CoA dehydrogenase